jgi:predicted peptidase
MQKMKNLKRKTLFLLFVCLVFVISLNAQTERFNKSIFTNGRGDTLKYRAIYPDYNPVRRYPLVIFLHGSGERGNDNEAQLKWGVMNFATDQAMTMYPAIIIAPQCPDNQEWSNYQSAENSREMHFLATPSKPMELLYQLIRQVIKDALVDTNRIYITGLSMGGYGTYDAITRYPGLFAAAVPVCGGGDTSKAAVFAHIPIWIYHGSEDPVVDPLLSVDMANALIRANAHPGLTLCPEFGHFSWLAAYSDPLLIEWMFRQHK